MTYADNYNIRTTSVKFNDVADAIDGSITRPFGGTTTGTTTAYIASPSPAWTAYDTASFITIIPHVTNAAGPVTLNVSGLGTKTIKRGGSDLVAGVLVQNIPTILIYTGVYFDVIAAANALLLDGSGTMLGNINFGGFRPINLAAGTATAPAICAGNDTNTGIFSPAPYNIGIATNSAERVRVDGAGLVYVNATTNAGVTAQVHLRSTTATRPALLVHQGVADTAAAFQVSKQTNSNTQDYVYFVYNNGASGNGKIVGNGADQAAFGSYSDERLKENIQELSPQLAHILALRPVEFDYKNGSGHQIGFIAQEVEPIYPDVVSADVRTDMLTLAGLGKWDARLVKAIQELAARVALLEGGV